MDWISKCAVVIPCFNEQENIASLVTQVKKTVPTIVVVDDGSTDSTAKRAEASGAKVIYHPRRQGKGAALMTGWKYAHDIGFKWALTMDGDGQHSPVETPEFFRCADKTGADLIVGNRMWQSEQMPWLRRWVNRWMSWRISKLTGLPLPDSQCGFRLMNLETWASLSISTTHFEIESEILLAFARAGHAIQFVPVQVIYRDERSKIRVLHDTVRWFRWLARTK